MNSRIVAVCTATGVGMLAAALWVPAVPSLDGKPALIGEHERREVEAKRAKARLPEAKAMAAGFEEQIAHLTDLIENPDQATPNTPEADREYLIGRRDRARESLAMSASLIETMERKVVPPPPPGPWAAWHGLRWMPIWDRGNTLIRWEALVATLALVALIGGGLLTWVVRRERRRLATTGS